MRAAVFKVNMGPSAPKAVLKAALAAAIAWAVYLLKGNIWFRLYPALAAGAFLAAFALSLLNTPLVERFARRMGEKLDARGVAYCRNATVAWTVFMAVHFAATVATLFVSREAWAVYNGFIAYVLVGAMFLGEYVARRRLMNG